jgi:hypothetical protein
MPINKLPHGYWDAPGYKPKPPSKKTLEEIAEGERMVNINSLPVALAFLEKTFGDDNSST